MSKAKRQLSDAARGASRLAFDAVEQVTNIVEAMHANIAAASPPLGKGTHGPTRGITGLVYDSTRLVNEVSRTTLDRALDLLTRHVEWPLPQPQADSLTSAVNGVLGDYLAATANPLAIAMRPRRHGQRLTLEREALAAALPGASSKILLVVHGLCMNDRQWHRKNHDHGAALARDSGYTPVYLHYNSGRHVSENGREFAALLEQLVDAWPVAVTELSVLAHSIGGLVTRSACHYGAEAKHRWLASLRRVVFLGTPHHGAPLERGGNSLQTILGISPYTAPLARLGWLRSAGITDLRYGNLLDEDWQDRNRFAPTGDPRQPVPLAQGVECYALAATIGQSRDDLNDRLLGDGLVRVASALGRHGDATKALPIPESHQWISYGTSHWDLLSDLGVYARLRDWHT